jgi:hypothetical protein
MLIHVISKLLFIHIKCNQIFQSYCSIHLNEIQEKSRPFHKTWQIKHSETKSKHSETFIHLLKLSPALQQTFNLLSQDFICLLTALHTNDRLWDFYMNF